jgi:hypothetical protein
MDIRLVPNRDALRRLRDISGGVGARMDDPSLLRALGRTHRKQQEAIFNSEGALGGAGKWAPLSQRYAARKAGAAASKRFFDVGLRSFFRGGKILQLSGAMKAAFTGTGPGYIQQFIPRGVLGVFRFGARSAVAAAHLQGNPSLAPKQSALARSVFGGRAKRLPIRDMVTKSEAQLAEMRETLRTWYIARVRQFLRGAGRLSRTT